MLEKLKRWVGLVADERKIEHEIKHHGLPSEELKKAREEEWRAWKDLEKELEPIRDILDLRTLIKSKLKEILE